MRKSSDHSLVASFPRLIAGSYVLHRLLVPRHPPCALINLATKMLVSRPLCSSQGTGGVPARVRRLPRRYGGAVQRGLVPTEGGSRDRAAPSGLNSVPRTRYRPDLVPAASSCTRRSARRGNQLVNIPPLSSIRGAIALGMGLGTRSEDLAPVLLRKEVIQPHLPVRLPCYDFVPIADPTFDGSLPYGLGHRLRVLPTFVT